MEGIVWSVDISDDVILTGNYEDEFIFQVRLNSNGTWNVKVIHPHEESVNVNKNSYKQAILWIDAVCQGLVELWIS